MGHITPHCPRCVQEQAHRNETIGTSELPATSYHANTDSRQAMFPFLPLPSLFEYTDTCQWQQLAEQIEHCLLADPFLNSNHPECYHFMLELFWMAFVAANPEFPRGKWPRWNALIPMEGEFISHWMLNSEDVEFIDVPLHFIIWEQFRSLISDTLLMPSTQ